MVLKKDENGIYLKGNRVSAISTQFSSELQDSYYDIENNSWWFAHRRDVVLCFAKKFFSLDNRVYDIGGGNGYISSQFVSDGYDVGLIEPSYEACLNSRRRGIPLIVNGSIEDVNSTISQCICLDVLEHIEDDKIFLTSIYNKMEKGGKLILAVPAFMSLYSSEDVKLGHFRRYRRKQLEALFMSVGFDVAYSSYHFWFSFFPIFIVRVLFEKLGVLKNQGKCSDEQNAMREASLHRPPKGIVGVILGFVEHIELWWLKNGHVVPFGSSLIIVAEKK